jgi:hypothetical protein
MRFGAAVSGLLLSFVVATPALADEGTFPWKAGDKPPTVAGISLGDTEDYVRDLLGVPSSTSKKDAGNILKYQSVGFEITTTKTDGVTVIRLLTAESGAIDDIRVGDNISAVISKWGHPNASQGRVASFSAGTWTVEVRLADNGPDIVSITLAWNATKWPDTDSSKAQTDRPQ